MQLSPSDFAHLDKPQTTLEDPPPNSPLAQQVRRLRDSGLYEAADAVNACGRLGELWKYECGREFLRKIIRSHRRFCCLRCDRHIAARLFEDHSAYRERLHPSGALHRITVRSSHYALTGEGICDFEDAIIQAVRRWLKDCEGWGLKFFTHYEAECLVAKGIVYLPSGAFRDLNSLSIPSGTFTVSRGVSVTAFEVMLAEILEPALKEGHCALRGDLMVAFHGGNHLRSLGVFYGLISKKRAEKRLEQTEEKLDLSSDAPTVSGTGLANPKRHPRREFPPCPHCGPGCKRVSISSATLSELQGIPSFDKNNPTERTLVEMRRLTRRRYVF